jgi:hypothetical protein
MSVRSKHLKLVGAVGAAALAVGTVATPAVAASQDLTYNCDVLMATKVSLDPGTIPATMVAGQTSKRTMSMVVHLDAAQTAVAHSFGSTVSGTIVAPGAHNTFPFTMTIPDQTIPSSGAMNVNASGPGKIRPLKAGTWTVSAGDMVANLAVDGSALPVAPNCVAPSNGTEDFGTIAVSKDKTTTAVTAAYNAKRDVASGKAKVKSHFGLKATGKVVFILKKGTKTIAKAGDTLNRKGVATHSFKHVKKHGKYSITAKYAGNNNLKGSSGKDAFRVG